MGLDVVNEPSPRLLQNPSVQNPQFLSVSLSDHSSSASAIPDYAASQKSSRSLAATMPCDLATTSSSKLSASVESSQQRLPLRHGDRAFQPQVPGPAQPQSRAHRRLQTHPAQLQRSMDKEQAVVLPLKREAPNHTQQHSRVLERMRSSSAAREASNHTQQRSRVFEGLRSAPCSVSILPGGDHQPATCVNREVMALVSPRHQQCTFKEESSHPACTLAQSRSLAAYTPPVSSLFYSNALLQQCSSAASIRCMRH